MVFSIPPGVISKIHEKMTVRGNPIARRMIINVVVQSGSDKAGARMSANWRITNAVAAYTTITLFVFRL